MPRISLDVGADKVKEAGTSESSPPNIVVNSQSNLTHHCFHIFPMAVAIKGDSAFQARSLVRTQSHIALVSPPIAVSSSTLFRPTNTQHQDLQAAQKKKKRLILEILYSIDPYSAKQTNSPPTISASTRNEEPRTLFGNTRGRRMREECRNCCRRG